MNPFLKAYNKVKFDDAGKVINKILASKDYVMLNKGLDESIRISVKARDKWYSKLSNSNDITMVMEIGKLLKLDDDIFHMTAEMFSDIPISSYYKAKAKLIEINLISPILSEKDKYYINPFFLFKGNAEALVKKYFVNTKRDNEYAGFKGDFKLDTNIDTFENSKGNNGDDPDINQKEVGQQKLF